MAIKSILRDWILVGVIIGIFLLVPRDFDGDQKDDLAPTERSLLPTPAPLKIWLPEINIDKEFSDLGSNDRFPETLLICRSMRISNAPQSNADLEITGYRQFIAVNGVSVAIAPIEQGCLSSGFGIRAERLHKGLDFHHRTPVEIYAAAHGIVREKTYRGDYGNMIVLEHGSGVFTRYAHLQSFVDGVEVGATMSVGEPIGLMGNTASYRIPIHLHYEVLVGEWAEQAGSFALTPVNVFARLSDN